MKFHYITSGIVWNEIPKEFAHSIILTFKNFNSDTEKEFRDWLEDVPEYAGECFFRRINYLIRNPNSIGTKVIFEFKFTIESTAILFKLTFA